MKLNAMLSLKHLTNACQEFLKVEYQILLLQLMGFN